MQETGLEKFSNLGVAVFEYDFATHGGAVSTIVLTNDYVPDDAIVLGGMIEVKAACTSDGSATVAFHLLSSEDVLAATAVASLTLAAQIDTVPVWTAATALKMTAATQLSCVIGTAALTAGRIFVSLIYVLTG
jgi:hypothetical protein